MVLSREDIENIADRIIADFRKETGIITIYTAIDQLASDYLRLNVSFEKLSNDDSFCGVTAYADTKFKVKINGRTRVVDIKKNQIILDADFVSSDKIRKLCGKRRFTLAHEVAHQILFQMESDEEQAKHIKKYSKRKAHTVKELKTAEDWNEWQANALGAALLMPRESVFIYMKAFGEVIENLNYPSDLDLYSDLIISKFCEYFHVSKSACIIRLKQLGYIKNDIKEAHYA